MSDVVSEALVEAIIEIPAGSQNKYEVDKKRGVLRLDRVLYSPVHYPTDYGFVDETLEEDGDPIDILVLVSNPTVPGCIVDTRIIGVLVMSDDKGVDNKLLGVAQRDPRYAQVKDLSDVPSHRLLEIEHFFRTYKELEGKQTVIEGWFGLKVALEKLRAARELYRRTRAAHAGG
nr:MAG: inorganic diphosphatase [Bacillota bacterium]